MSELNDFAVIIFESNDLSVQASDVSAAWGTLVPVAPPFVGSSVV